MTPKAPSHVPRQPLRRRLRAWVLVCGLVGAPQAAFAESEAGGAPAALVTEVQRLRGDLERVNRDVEALKRGERGLRDDARLRQRMADAEAIARRLTDAERRLSTFGSPAIPLRPLAPLPNAQPGDGPAELSAKADILTDEARKLTREAERMARAADSVRGRELLRRRVGQLDRDPFAGFESSKRSLAFSAAQRPFADNASAPTAPPARVGGTPTVATDESTKAGAETPAPTAPPMTAGPAAVSNGPGGVSTGGPTSPTPSSPAPGNSGPGGQVAAPAEAGTPSLVFRTLLDPATLAELRRIEAQGTPGARAEAFARAAAALRARATALEGEAAALRRLAKQK